jgi:hypothetical protein
VQASVVAPVDPPALERPLPPPHTSIIKVLRRPLESALAPGIGVVQQLTRLDRDPFAGPGPQRDRSGVRTRSVTLVVAACQPTIRWANTSTTKAT